jgi:erythromycin esterase-like protein
MLKRSELLDRVAREARPLASIHDVDPILEQIGDASLVLLGEATHGSHEFYALRAELSRRLVAEKGFDAIAVEADWPDALRVTRHLMGQGRASDAHGALGSFERFPRWMWRNREVAEFVQALRRHNDRLAEDRPKVGFYGLDLYSLAGSIDAVIRYLQQVDPELAREAKGRYACFDHLAGDPQRYGYAARYGLTDGCEQEVVAQLQALLTQSTQSLVLHDAPAEDELFYAQQNARVVRDAERYYRVMFQAGPTSWNARDEHMADTLFALQRHLSERRGRPAKIVVWAHNSHIGDARATQFADEGQWNLGQLVRERQAHEGDSFLLGFTTHTGTVAAASDWDEPVEHKHVRLSRDDSIERLLHDAGLPLALVPLRGALKEPLSAPYLQRAIGVIYRPDTERWSHYFDAHLSGQFDAVVHIDRTHAVAPLDPSTLWKPSTAEETYPTGL